MMALPASFGVYPGSDPVYTYFRLNYSAAQSGTGIGTYEFQLYNSANVNILTGGTASASSTLAGTTAANAFDGSDSTRHQNATGVLPFTLQYQTTVADTPYRLEMHITNAKTWTMEVSNDGSSWTVLHNFVDQELVNTVTAQNFSWGLPGLEMWRLNISAVQGGGTLCQIREMALSIGVGGAQLLAGGTASASSWNGANPPANAFDGAASIWANDTTSDPASGGTQLFYILPYGTRISPDTLTITCQTSGQLFAPSSFTLEKTFDGGATWTVAGTYSFSAWTSGLTKTFTVP